VCVDDIGDVINPMIVEGQVHGGLAQGIAQALYEEAVHDDQGTLTTATFVDYLVPGAPDLPHFTTDRTVTSATTNELGVKGVGEAGCIASTPAVVNAALDAVRHLGVRDIEMPLSPQRVWKALQGASVSTGAGEEAHAAPHWDAPVQSGGGIATGEGPEVSAGSDEGGRL
jgi:carbon-monoxide dehydrogenase large subunit